MCRLHVRVSNWAHTTSHMIHKYDALRTVTHVPRDDMKVCVRDLLPSRLPTVGHHIDGRRAVHGQVCNDAQQGSTCYKHMLQARVTSTCYKHMLQAHVTSTCYKHVCGNLFANRAAPGLARYLVESHTGQTLRVSGRVQLDCVD